MIDERRAGQGGERGGGPGRWGGGRRRRLNSLLVSQVLGGYRLNSCLAPPTLRRAVISGDGGANESDRGAEQSFPFHSSSSSVREIRKAGRACLHEGAPLIRLTAL